MDQLQEVCLALGAEDLSTLSDRLQEAVDDKCDDHMKAIELLHDEIKKTGGTPIEDLSVELKADDSESTATPCSDVEAESAPDTPEKQTTSTAADVEAERLENEAREAEARRQAEAKEAHHRQLQEKKAEELREKKKEQKRKEEEKRVVAERKAEAAQRAKQRKAEEKAKATADAAAAAAKEVEAFRSQASSIAVEAAAALSVKRALVNKNAVLKVLEEAAVFKSTESSDSIATAEANDLLVAAGSPVDVEGYLMVPLQPCGSIELRVVECVQSSCEAIPAPEDTPPAASVSQTKVKAVKHSAPEEDLDALLNEFGIEVKAVTTSSKKKGKK